MQAHTKYKTTNISSDGYTVIIHMKICTYKKILAVQYTVLTQLSQYYLVCYGCSMKTGRHTAD